MMSLHVLKFQLVSADACGGGTCDESLRVSEWEATLILTHSLLMVRLYIYTCNSFIPEVLPCLWHIKKHGIVSK